MKNESEMKDTKKSCQNEKKNKRKEVQLGKQPANMQILKCKNFAQ